MEFLPHALAAFFALVAIVLNELCKPADRKWKLTGSKWRLPSGPQGKPLIGNLSQFFKARDSGDFVPYVGCPAAILVSESKTDHVVEAQVHCQIWGNDYPSSRFSDMGDLE